MKQYSHLHYKDSDHLKTEEEKKPTEEQQKEEEELKEKLEKGEISEAEYNTLSKTGKKVNEIEIEFVDMDEPRDEEPEQQQSLGQTYAKDDAY